MTEIKLNPAALLNASKVFFDKLKAEIGTIDAGLVGNPRKAFLEILGYALYFQRDWEMMDDSTEGNKTKQLQITIAKGIKAALMDYLTATMVAEQPKEQPKEQPATTVAAPLPEGVSPDKVIDVPSVES